MRPGLTISCVGHAAVLLWGLVTFSVRPMDATPAESLPVDIVSATDFSEMMAGSKTAPKAETPKPLVDKIAEPTPAKQPAPKVVEKPEITTASAEPPPLPEPRPAEQPEKKDPDPKLDQIAEALKKEEAKKQAPPKPQAKVPTPPKKPVQQAPKFDAQRVAALLDKRDPQRRAAAGDVLNSTPTLGADTGTAARLSQSELDALRARLIQLWNPPGGLINPEEFIVRVRIRLNPDGRLAGPPQVLNSGNGTLFAATRDSAVRAVLRGQPFDMLSPAKYDSWKEIEINFDPRDVYRG
jgi:colicin import membrane protein